MGLRITKNTRGIYIIKTCVIMSKDYPDLEAVNRVTNVCHYHHDWQNPEPLSHSVVQAIADHTRTNPERSPPLSEAIHTDSLDQIFSIHRSPSHCTDHLVFTHCGCTIVVYRDGHILVHPAEHDHSSPVE